MASPLGLFMLVVAAAAIAFVGASNQYRVGDSEGWRMPGENDTDLYAVWASKIRFQVGDSILFEYRNDSVVRVDKRGYYHCNETSHAEVLKDGSTVFLVDRPGFYYFVSGELEHCKKGQRLMVDVMSSHLPLLPTTPSPSPLPSAAVSLIVPSLCSLVALASFMIATVLLALV